MTTTETATRAERSAVDVAALARRALAEVIGTAFLLAGVVGSAIMATQLTTDPGLRLLINAFATAGVLVAVILALGPASGAHLNPAVTLADRLLGGMDTVTAVVYVVAQLVGAFLGVLAAHVMFEEAVIDWSSTARDGSHLFVAETIATFGLVLVIFGVVRSGRSGVAAFAVGAYIGAAYFFTSSTSFANPAVTIARMTTDTASGIEPGSGPAFLVAQVIGALAAVLAARLVYPDISDVASQVVVPHDS